MFKKACLVLSLGLSKQRPQPLGRAGRAEEYVSTARRRERRWRHFSTFPCIGFPCWGDQCLGRQMLFLFQVQQAPSFFCNSLKTSGATPTPTPGSEYRRRKVTNASDTFPMTVLGYSFPTEPLNLNQYKKGRSGNGQLTNWR